jgi:mono/diheme cytochrome c family protein/glucose/arabinose dehydrogenase
MKPIATRAWIVAAAAMLSGAFTATQAPAPQSPSPALPDLNARPTSVGRVFRPGDQQQPPATQEGRGGFDDAAGDFLKRPPVVRQDPAVQQKLFLLPPGYKIELVLSDPEIQDPVGVTFDGNGRMYVLEMRSYMQDADGSGSRAPISRISRHEDTDGDGVYDKHTVFADKMVMPRIAFPLGDGIILGLETDNRDLYKYTDNDGDGVADKKELFYPGFGRVTNMEWQPGGLTWALDNWLYSTYNPFRLRIARNGNVLREETEANGGQWWSAQDNYGKVWWVDGGGEIGPVNFQTPIVYGAFNVPDNFEPDFQVPWPAPGGISDMQGGLRRIRLPDGTLNHFTAASGVEIYRGDRLPQDTIGDLFFNEPVGRIVRRAKVVVTEGLTQLRNAYTKSEFVRSTDPLFRPVSISNAPDGSLYLVDMYTGIIQDAQWAGPGTYLRRKIEQYDLDKQHNWGRIWRISYEGTPLDRTMPRMYQETPAQLVRHLEHANGWWRDTAQKLLVLGQDKSLVPALRTMARGSANHLARIHALWTLEGLGALDAGLAREFMKSPNPLLRIQGIRASESLYKATPGDKSFAADYRAMTKDPDPDVVIQAMLTLNLQMIPETRELIRTIADSSSVRGVKEIGSQLLQPRQSQGQGPALSDTGAGMVNFTVDQRRSRQRGEAIYRELCATCHGPDGKGAPMAGAPEGVTLAPPLAESRRVQAHRDYVIKVLLHGLMGPIDGKDYPGGVMVSMGTNTDEWVADVATFVRTSFGNSAAAVTPEQVAAVRKQSSRKTPWTYTELERLVPTLLANRSAWKVSASHNTEAAANVVGEVGRWDSGAPQQPGMWFQIALPEEVTVSELQIDSTVRGRPLFPPRETRVAPAAGRVRQRVLSPTSGPVSYAVQVSFDGSSWGSPVAEGEGQTPTTIIRLEPVRAKFIRITQTGTAQDGNAWGIQQIRIYALPSRS